MDDDESRSKPTGKTDLLSFGEIGGVGQLIYHGFRFAGYEVYVDDKAGMLAEPVCGPGNPPDVAARDDLTGKGILESLCELARKIDDVSDGSDYQALIVAWCAENMHPYAIDFIYKELTAGTFDAEDHMDVRMLKQDGTFSISAFMHDLEKLYNAARFHVALTEICYANDEPAYNLYGEGKHFEAPPIFEYYKRNTDLPDLDLSAAEGDLLKEMELGNKYLDEHPLPQPPAGVFYKEPYDEYEKLREELVDYIPDFRLRLKADPKSNRLVFAADIDSVFDIAWYTLARMMAEDPAPEDFGKADRPKGIMIRCAHCGRFFFPRDGRQKYCTDRDCQNSRNTLKVRRHRERNAQTKARSEKNQG